MLFEEKHSVISRLSSIISLSKFRNHHPIVFFDQSKFLKIKWETPIELGVTSRSIFF